MDYIITQDNLDAFQKELEAMGKSPVTIEKYSRDICKLWDGIKVPVVKRDKVAEKKAEEYLTAQALRRGYVEVPRGGNMLRIFLPQGILEGLRDYMVRCGIWQGPVFLTSSGKPVHRTNIWREIKALCRDAGVEERKVSIGSLKKRVRHQYYPVENT